MLALVLQSDRSRSDFRTPNRVDDGGSRLILSKAELTDTIRHDVLV
jgi:hypothetical protein